MTQLPTEQPYVEVLLKVRSTAEGGRAAPVYPGYRASWRVPQPDGTVAYTDGAVYPLEIEELAPGTSGIVRIYPLQHENWRSLPAGTEVEMCEGPRVVGAAKVERGLSSGSPRQAPTGAAAST